MTTKSTCDSCKRIYNTRRLVMIKGRRLCSNCKAEKDVPHFRREEMTPAIKRTRACRRCGRLHKTTCKMSGALCPKCNRRNFKA